MLLRSACILVVFMIFLTASVCFAAPMDNFTKQCFDYLGARDFKRAFDAGKKAVSKKPKSFDANYCLGQVLLYTGNFKMALPYLREAEKYASQKRDLMVVYNLLGMLYEKMGDLDNALRYKFNCLTLARQLNNTVAESAALNNIAGIYYNQGQLDKALKFYEDSLRLESEESYKALIYNNIASVFIDKKDYEKALEYYFKAQQIAERYGDYQSLAYVILNIGNCYRHIKRYDDSLKYLNDGLSRAQKIGDRHWEAIAYLNIGYLYLDTGDFQKAKNSFNKSLAIANSIGAARLAQRAHMSLSELDAIKK